ncbi:hypothetical protein [Pontibacter populi]|uniref:Guanylate cyclase domain-containing protein n=1 Tax=Pontibacter populi TaxID=890055 RepID=A0ABV1RQ14_9BACT
MYSEKIVAFIDLLGFKQSVLNRSFEEINEIISEFNRVLHFADDQNSTSLGIAHFASKQSSGESIRSDANKQNIIFFSDCVVWSYPMDNIKVDFTFVLDELLCFFSLLQHGLYDKGILIRGGVSIGSLYHRSTRIFGEGLIKAYELEQKAVYPRIVFDNCFIDRLQPHMKSFFKHRITYSPKGFFALDLFRDINLWNELIIKNEKNFPVRNTLAKQVENICKIIAHGKQFRSRNLREKYDWMEKKLRAIENLQVPLVGI